MKNARLGGMDLLEQVLDDLFLKAARRRTHPIGTIFQFVALVNEQCGIAAIIDNQLRSKTLRIDESLPGAPPVFLQRFAFPCIDGNVAGGDCGGGMILGRENVATYPTNLRAEIGERFNEHGGLDCHVQRPHDANPLQGLFRSVFVTGRHQTGHLVLGNFNFLAAEIGKADVAYFVVGKTHGCLVVDVRFSDIRHKTCV